MTNAEMTYYNDVHRIASSMNNKEIDWEQRRYEIAKDMFTASGFGGNNGSPCGWISNDESYMNKMARNAVLFADALINELKK